MGEELPEDAVCDGMTATQLQRLLDSLRMHVPTEQERTLLKLGSGDRFVIGPDKRVLHQFCGAYRGVRFTTTEVQALTTLSRASEAAYLELDRAYKALSIKARKLKFSTPLPSGQGAEAEVTEGFGGLDDLDMYVAPSAEQILSNAAAAPTMDPDDEKRATYQSAALMFLSAFRDLAELCCKKQREIDGFDKFIAGDGTEAAHELQEIVVNKDHGEGLDRAKPLPQWLSVLANKYRAESGYVPPPSGGLLDSVGMFAVFLSCCLFDPKSTLTEDEEESFYCLLNASDDGTGVSVHSAPHFCEDDSSVRGNAKSQKYWARRMWRFMKNVRELKAVPKDEKALDKPEIIARWM